MLMDILPVLDLLNGLVVRGVGGKREEYRPVVSRLANSPDALSMAQAFRQQLGLNRVYVADLDAILHGRPNREIYQSLAEEGFELMIDAGFRTVESAQAVLAAKTVQIIAGLETWPGPRELAWLCRDLGPERVIFSLDLKQGLPLGDLGPWKTSSPLEIGVLAAVAGVREMIVLDLAQVGNGTGVTTVSLCLQLRERFPELRLITGGGIRHVADLDELAAVGIDGVLVATALHDGRITRADLERHAATRRKTPRNDPDGRISITEGG
jgi:phosphoribosylformimino-5-aminoimidazole carboxamide ribotide isomerase